jgi:hypothetical protein
MESSMQQQTAATSETASSNCALKNRISGWLITLRPRIKLNERDNDLGSSGPVLLADQSGAHPHLLVTAGKDAHMFTWMIHIFPYEPDFKEVFSMNDDVAHVH